jgi:hypothetical protein
MLILVFDSLCCITNGNHFVKSNPAEYPSPQKTPFNPVFLLDPFVPLLYSLSIMKQVLIKKGKQKRAPVESCLIVAVVVFLLLGCATSRYLPPRYVEPSLPTEQFSLIVAKGYGIGIFSVDKAIVCEPADYSVEGLEKVSPPSSVRLAPGTHEVVFACWWGSEGTKISKTMSFVSGKRYIATRRVEGYTITLSVQMEE